MSDDDSALPRGVRAVARWQPIGAALVIAVPAGFAATVVPYRYWDSMAFGLWSRLIAADGELFPDDVTTAMLHRPLFYVAQGLGWWWVDDGEWVGRWLTLLFAAVLVASLWPLAGRLASTRDGRALLRPMAISTALASSALALVIVAGMSDLPVAAMAALTAVCLWWRARPSVRVPLVALAAAATGLAKPSGFVALAGVALATVAVRWGAERREMLLDVAGLAAGTAVALAYHVWQATRLGISLGDELSSGNSEFYLERGAAARPDAVLQAEWLGAGVRIVVVAGVLYSVLRALGAPPRRAAAVAGPGAVVGSVVGPVAALGELPYPFAGPSWLGVAGWLGLAAALVAMPFLIVGDPVPRRAHVALVAWMAPGFAAWLAFRSDEARFLSPAWPPLALAAGAVLTAAALGLGRRRAALALAPLAALTVLVVANTVAIDGLGRAGWRELLEMGPSGWGDRAEIENFAYGPFSYQLALVREHRRPDGRIVSSDARMPYFFPRHAEVGYQTSCGDLAKLEADVFVLLLGDESVEFMERVHGGTADPLAWEQCTSPRLYPVGAQEGIYAAFVVGRPPARSPRPEECRVTSTPGELLDGVFVEGVSYGEARAVQERAAGVGYDRALIERIGCGSYRVVVTGVPTPEENQADFLRESSSVGFDARVVPPLRYPEVPADVEPVPETR